MDRNISSNSSVALVIAFLAFMFIVIKLYNNKMYSSRKLPPGPWRLPIIGNMHQMLTSSLPHRRLADLAKKHGPVMYLKLGEVSNVVVSSRQAAEEVVRTNDILLADRPVTIAASIILYNCRDVAFAPYGEYWRQLKKIFVVHLASAKQVDSFKLVREFEVISLVRSINGLSRNGSSPVNLSKMLHTLTTSIISRAAFGDSCKWVDAFTPLVTRVSEIFAGFNISDFFPSVRVLHSISGVKDKVDRLHQEIEHVLDMVISEYKASRDAGRNDGNGIIGALLDMQDQSDSKDSLPTESIKATLIDVFTGGIETGAIVLQWTMSEIMKHPQVMKNVQEEVRQVFKNKSNIDEAGLCQLKYMDAIIKETLRLHPPLPLLLPREARENVTINGYEIPAKTRVLINVWAIGRDPEIWTNAEEFHPERFLETSIDYKGSHVELIPFGAGRRICPGITFGMSGVELTLANLLYHFDWELPDGVEPDFLDMSEVPGSVVGRKHDLCLIATPCRT